MSGWLYRNAEVALIEGAISDLRTDARLVEATALRDINRTIDQMGRVAEGTKPTMALVESIAGATPVRVFSGETRGDVAILRRPRLRTGAEWRTWVARQDGTGPAQVYKAAEQWVDRCLRRDDSLFTPGRAI